MTTKISPIEAKNFLDDNREQFKLLSKKMVECQSNLSIDKTLPAEDIKAELIGRVIAIEIVSDWINELFEIRNGEIMNLTSDEDDMITIHEQVES